MAIVRWNPGILTNPAHLFEDFFKTEFPEWSRRNFSAEGSDLPAVNIKETSDGYQLEVAAPGMNKKDFNISIDKGVLTISAEKEFSDKKEEKGYTRKEFSYQSFQRSFTLPESADEAKISASYTNGILTVMLPKKPEAKPKPAKTIKIG